MSSVQLHKIIFCAYPITISALITVLKENRFFKNHGIKFLVTFYSRNFLSFAVYIIRDQQIGFHGLQLPSAVGYFIASAGVIVEIPESWYSIPIYIKGAHNDGKDLSAYPWQTGCRQR